jgi:hypothetical protein
MACSLIQPDFELSGKTPTKDNYKNILFFNALMQDASKALERIPAPEIGKRGNSKIHERGSKAITLVYSGVAWHDCFPTKGCDNCYAMGFRYRHALAHRNGKAWLYSYMSRHAIDQLEYIINSEISEQFIRAKRLGVKLAVRIHESGDFISPSHVAMWDRIAKNNPGVIFWCYTRSDKASDSLRQAIMTFADNFNVHCRASFDPVDDTADVIRYRNGMPGAIQIGTKYRGKLKGPAKVSGTVNCPEQITNGDIGCADCGLCWHPSKPVIRFYQH